MGQTSGKFRRQKRGILVMPGMSFAQAIAPRRASARRSVDVKIFTPTFSTRAPRNTFIKPPPASGASSLDRVVLS